MPRKNPKVTIKLKRDLINKKSMKNKWKLMKSAERKKPKNLSSKE